MLDYTGPGSSRIEFFLITSSDKNSATIKSLSKIDAKELDLLRKTHYKSPYLNNNVGSDVVTVTYGDRQWDYDFENNTVTENQ